MLPTRGLILLHLKGSWDWAVPQWLSPRAPFHTGAQWSVDLSSLESWVRGVGLKCLPAFLYSLLVLRFSYLVYPRLQL